MPDISILNNEQ